MISTHNSGRKCYCLKVKALAYNPRRRTHGTLRDNVSRVMCPIFDLVTLTQRQHTCWGGPKALGRGIPNTEAEEGIGGPVRRRRGRSRWTSRSESRHRDVLCFSPEGPTKDPAKSGGGQTLGASLQSKAHYQGRTIRGPRESNASHARVPTTHAPHPPPPSLALTLTPLPTWACHQDTAVFPCMVMSRTVQATAVVARRLGLRAVHGPVRVQAQSQSDLEKRHH